MTKDNLPEKEFEEVILIIRDTRNRVFKNVNKELIALYWKIGEYICKKVDEGGWGNSTIKQLATHIQTQLPGVNGFSWRNLYRMKDFYQTYCENKELSTLLAKISWSNNIIIISKTNSEEEREFYLRLSIKENLTARELERQIDSSFYERSLLSSKNVSRSVIPFQEDSCFPFRDTYILDFLDLPSNHSENDLKMGILRNMKQFLLELGKDFIFIGEEYRIQVGKHDYYLDLLFYHRDLRCLVAIELKCREFKPEYRGKMDLYLEALDRDVKKAHENPSVGIILCKGKDDDVVEYTLCRSLSPAMVAEYRTKLIDKKIVQEKFRELVSILSLTDGI